MFTGDTSKIVCLVTFWHRKMSTLFRLMILGIRADSSSLGLDFLILNICLEYLSVLITGRDCFETEGFCFVGVFCKAWL